MEGLIVAESPRIFDLLANVSDTTRTRLLLVLEEQEFTVSELCAVLQLPQSTVSRHLKVLADDGWLTSQQDGTSRRYRMAGSLAHEAAELWALVRRTVIDLPSAIQDGIRAEAIVNDRRSRSEAFFENAASDWDRLRKEMFGGRADLQAMLALVDPEAVVGDLGCGTGALSAKLAPFAGRVIAVDASREMLRAARARLRRFVDVDVRRGALERLPIDDESLDVAVLFLVLHYVVDPARVFAESYRALRPGGRLIVADMTPHDRAQYQNDMGHVWLGFDRGQVEGWLETVGFRDVAYRPLPPDPAATGPALFVLSARRPPVAGESTDDVAEPAASRPTHR